MALLASAFLQPLRLAVVAGLLSSLATGCDVPPQTTKALTEPPAVPVSQAAATANISAEYAIDSVAIKREKQANLTLQATYPRLRPQPGTAPADTVGMRAFNREARKFAEGLVKEIEATARENRRDKTPTSLQVSFRAYLLQHGLASVAFTVEQGGIGPRPITWATGLTYDLRTGRKVQPSDLFKQSAAFKKAITDALQPAIAGNDDCQPEPDNMAWDNFALGPDAYYLLLGDAQVGRACDVRAVRVPLAQLQLFAVASSPAARLKR
jgi:hypothetical protein